MGVQYAPCVICKLTRMFISVFLVPAAWIIISGFLLQSSPATGLVSLSLLR